MQITLVENFFSKYRSIKKERSLILDFFFVLMRRYFNSMENLLNECEIINPFGEFLSGEMIVKILSFYSDLVIRDLEKETRKSKLICD